MQGIDDNEDIITGDEDLNGHLIMAAEFSGLQPPHKLAIDITSTTMKSIWEEWISTLEMYFLASNIDDSKRKKALLLYVGGEELQIRHRILWFRYII